MYTFSSNTTPPSGTWDEKSVSYIIEESWFIDKQFLKVSLSSMIKSTIFLSQVRKGGVVLEQGVYTHSISNSL